MVLPTPGMSTLSFLSAITTDCDHTIFTCEELGVILNELWEQEIKWMFIVDFLLYVMFCVCWTVLVTSTTVRIVRDATSEQSAFQNVPLETNHSACT